MKIRLLVLLCVVSVLSPVAWAADKAPAPVATIIAKKSALAVGSGSFALVKGTKLEVISREGDLLIVKYRAVQGKVPRADTDFPPDTVLPESTPAPAAAPAAPEKAAPVAAPTPPPALALDGKPATNYGKAVQKAKQVEQAHKSSHVDPTKDILDDQPKK